jgi:hypothetical protein
MGVLADSSASYLASGRNVHIALPGERRMYCIDDPALAWHQDFNQADFDAEIFDEYWQEVRFESGKRQHAQWNQDPVLVAPFRPNVHSRSGDSVYIRPTLLGDSEGRAGSGDW